MSTATFCTPKLLPTILGLLLLVINHTLADDITGKVIAVHDGDSITLITDDKAQIKIRLASIDAPEMGQPFGKAAKKVLSDMIFGKTVRISDKGQDLYHRTLADVYVGKAG